MTMSRYKVLWIDDQWEDMSSFIDLCAWPENNIEVIPFKFAKEGMQYYEAHLNEWSGVVLDAKCLLESDNEVARLKGLAFCVNRINQLSSKRSIPYFIFTGQPDLLSDESFKDTYEKFYVKAEQDDDLIADIKSAAEKLEEIQLAAKYEDVIDVLPDSRNKLMEILMAVEHGVTNDAEIIVKIRKMLEGVMTYCYDHGLSLCRFTGSNLSECSKFMGQEWMSDLFIPKYIQEVMKSCVRIANPSAHTLPIDIAITNNQAPYIIRQVFYGLLTLLYWCKSLPQTEEKILKLNLDIIEMQDKQDKIIPIESKTVIEEYEGKKVIIEKDDNNNLHGGKCMILRKLAHLIGQEVTLIDVVINTDTKTNSIYPYFGKTKQ